MSNTTYNGHPSWDHWNASLWAANDYELYELFTSLELDDLLHIMDGYTTPDGCIFTSDLIQYAHQTTNEE
jgi:hypothetical protein